MTNTAGAGLGNIQVREGMIKFGTGSNVGAGYSLTANATLAGTVTIDLNGTSQTATALTLQGGTATSLPVITGAGSNLTLSGGVTYTATNNPLGGVISVGTLTMGAASRTFTVNNSTGAVDDLTLTSAVTLQGDAGVGLIKAGAGTLRIDGTNNLTGALEVQGGSVAGNLGSGNLLLNGGTIEASGTFSRALGTGTNQVQWAAGAVGGFAARGGALTVTLSGAPDPLVWDSTPNFVSGAGQLLFNSVSGDDAVTFTHNIDLNSTGTPLARTVQVLDNAAVTTDKAVLSGVLSNSGAAASLTKTGTGLLELSGLNTYTGDNNVTAGTLSFSSAANLGDTATVTNLNLGNGTTGTATLLYTGSANTTINDKLVLNSTTGAITLSSTGTGAVIFADTGAIATGAGTAKTLTLTGTSTADNEIKGIIQNNLDGTNLTNVSKTGAGVWLLSGANTYNNTTVNGDTGILRLVGAGKLGTGSLTVNAGTLEITAGGVDQTVSALTMGGGAAATTSLVSIGAGRKLTLGGNVTYSATNNPLVGTISGGTGALLDFGGAARTFTVGNSTGADIDMIIGANVTLQNDGGGGLIKAGAGTLQISGTNSLTGPVEIQAGSILGNIGTGNLVLNNGVYESSGTFTRSLGTGSGQVQWFAGASGGFAANGAPLTVTLGGAPDPLVWDSTTNFVTGAGGLLFGSVSATDVVTFTHNIDLNSTAGAVTRTVTVNDNTALTTDMAVLGGVLSQSGAGVVTLNKAGAGVLQLNGANTFTGGVTVTAGTLQFSTVSNNGGAASNLGQGTDGITLSGGTLSFVGDTLSQSTNRAITTTATSTLSANGTSGAVITYAGAITTGTDFGLILTGTGSGIISGGITQPAGTAVADVTINSGDWKISGANSSIADDLLLNGGTLTLENTVFSLADDVVVTGATSVLNLNTTGVLSAINPAGTSSGIFVRSGAVVNLNANDIYGVANANGLDFILAGDSGGPAVGVFNTNTFNIATPRLDLGAIGTGL